MYIISHRPSQPIPSEAMIYPLNEHGRMFYVTQLDKILAGDLMFCAAFGLFVVAALILAFFKPFADPSDYIR